MVQSDEFIKVGGTVGVWSLINSSSLVYVCMMYICMQIHGDGLIQAQYSVYSLYRYTVMV